MINRKTIAKALAQENGRFEGVEVEHGNGYWYFTGGDTGRWRWTGVYIYRMNQYTLKDWIEAAYECKYEMTKAEVESRDLAFADNEYWGWVGELESAGRSYPDDVSSDDCAAMVRQLADTFHVDFDQLNAKIHEEG
jgi:hypothetical protein